MPERKAQTHATLGEYGQGAIGPEPRIKNGEITEAEVDEFVEALQSDEFYDETKGFLPACCVDGRHRLDGECRLGPNAAGGVFSLVAADMLTTQTLRLDAHDSAGYAQNVFDYLNRTYPGQFGGHNDDRVSNTGTDSGCGAVDRMAQVISLIASHGDALRSAAGSLGIVIDDDDFDVIVGRAQQIAQEHGLEISEGSGMMRALQRVAGTGSVETLTGDHNEVAVVINEREGTTLNRAKIRERHGDKLQAFNYDRWAMRKAVHAISQNLEQDEARLKLSAADMYNLAVACTLAGPSLRVARRGEMAMVR